jgi:hypothetical protein
MFFKKELVEAAERMSLALSNDDITTYMVSNFGSMKLKDYIKEQYSGYVTCLIEYLLLIGDYESVIILLPSPPPNTPSPKVESCIGFVKLKGWKSDCFVTDGHLWGSHQLSGALETNWIFHRVFCSFVWLLSIQESENQLQSSLR